MYKLEGLSTFYRGWQLSLGQACGAAGSLLLFDKIGSDVKKKNRIWVDYIKDKKKRK